MSRLSRNPIGSPQNLACAWRILPAGHRSCTPIDGRNVFQRRLAVNDPLLSEDHIVRRHEGCGSMTFLAR